MTILASDRPSSVMCAPPCLQPLEAAIVSFFIALKCLTYLLVKLAVVFVALSSAVAAWGMGRYGVLRRPYSA